MGPRVRSIVCSRESRYWNTEAVRKSLQGWLERSVEEASPTILFLRASYISIIPSKEKLKKLLQ